MFCEIYMHMKKIISLFTALISLFAISCTTNVAVDSSVNPIGTYDNLTDDFTGQIYGTVPQVFKAANIATRVNFGWQGTGENSRSDSKRVFRVRTELDNLVYITMVQLEGGITEVTIASDNDLMFGQRVFNEIARETRKITGR